MPLTPSELILNDEKSLPPWAVGRSVADVLAERPGLDQWWTPLLLVDRRRLSHNIGFFASWARALGVEHMPHGKTSMAPELWREQIDAGASGITVATPWQARIAVESGIATIMLANQVADPHTAQWLAHHQSESAQVIPWVDSPLAVDLLADAGRQAGTTIGVLVEVGRPGGRTGTRSLADARALIARIHHSDGVTLAGIAGYEGAVTHGRGADALATVKTFVTDLVGLAREARTGDAPLIVTAGGSAYPDVVADALSMAVAEGMRGILRSGAYILHDEGHYEEISPFDHGRLAGGLLPAARAHARVVSAPEPGLVLLDAGKRDLPYDEGLPRPLRAWTADGRSIDLAATGSDSQPDDAQPAKVTALNDQHAFLATGSAVLSVGDVVELGLSHPCTMTDKWRLIPVVDNLERGRDAVIVDFLQTHF
ncbi:alanine racemase [Demequina sediminicola]|uniref:alanine racemase n=1 Tax=Demequina sediminicola TaxID=1095026 RepID=UPI000ACB0245|nr:alanine racemase [Demequina sediminicola]